MIKIDVLINEKKWKKYITNPQNYLKNKINKIKSLIPIIKNKKVVFSVLLTGNNQIKNNVRGILQSGKCQHIRI